MDRFYIFADVKDGLQSLGEGSGLGRALRAAEISGKLEGYIQTMSRHVMDLQVRMF